MYSSSSTLRTGCLATLLALAVPWLDVEPLFRLRRSSSSTASPRISSSRKLSSCPRPQPCRIDAVGLEAADGARHADDAQGDVERQAARAAMGRERLDHRSADPGGRLGPQRAATHPWELGIRERFSGTVTLPAGSYEAFYAFYPSRYLVRGRQAREREAWWIGSGMAPILGTIDALDLKIHGEGTILNARLAKANAAFAAGAIVNSGATANSSCRKPGSRSRRRPRLRCVQSARPGRTAISTPAGSSTPTRAADLEADVDGSEPAGGARRIGSSS